MKRTNVKGAWKLLIIVISLNKIKNIKETQLSGLMGAQSKQTVHKVPVIFGPKFKVTPQLDLDPHLDPDSQ